MKQRTLYDLDRRTIQERFARFHQEHPEVYAELVRLARQWRAAGKKRGRRRSEEIP